MITLAYAAKLGFVTQKTNINTEKIKRSARVIYEMAITNFLFLNRLEKILFFRILFLTVFEADLHFAKKEFV